MINFRIFLQGTGYVKTPSTEEIIFFIVMVVLIGIFFTLANYIISKKKHGGHSTQKYNRFLSRKMAQNFGFQPPHIKLFEKAVKEQSIAHPVLLFSNRRMLDNFLKKAVYSLEKENNLGNEEKQTRRRYIYEIREKIEGHFKKHAGIKSTHFIKPQQQLVIKTDKGETFHSRVLSNQSGIITCSYPLTDSKHPLKLRKSLPITVSFWRDHDTGYRFRTKIAGFDSKSKYSHFYIAHANKLTVIQNRKNQRKPINASCYFYPVEVLAQDNRHHRKRIQVHYESRYLGTMKDISAQGCRITGNHIFKKEELVKIEFTISKGQIITAFGKIKNLSRKGGAAMGIRFRKISDKDKNQIYSYIFNYI